MSSSPFISLGSKGTSLPPQLTQLDAPLQIGENRINWSRGSYKQLGELADGWVSKATPKDPFLLFPLDQALAEARVFHVPQIAWTSNEGRFVGEAFFPATWRFGDLQPFYVAVRAPGWNHGCVERERNKGNRGRWVGTFDFDVAETSRQNPNTRTASRSRSTALRTLETELDAKGEFEIADVDHGRLKALRNITRRRGQPAFRSSLLKLYGQRCVVSGTSVEEVLEAAHIRPYDGPSTNQPQNGLLLRADLHTLFDLGLFAIDPRTRTVVFSRRLKGTTYDREFSGKRVRGPIEKRFEPSAQALSDHFRQREP